MIDIKDLRKSFEDHEVLKGINLHINPKEVVVIIGPSGSGKSTLLRCMNMLEEPTSGKVVVDGIELNGEANISLFTGFSLIKHIQREGRYVLFFIS